MGRIVRRKKGGPSNADLPRRNSSTGCDPRRSCRRRNVRYNFDIDDYVDDEDFFEDVGRREKKLRVLLGEDDSESNRSSSSDDYDEDDEVKPSKKRIIDGDDGEFDGEDDEDNEIGELRGGKVEEAEEDAEAAGGANPVPGTPSDPPKGVFLPEKKTLELMLDKLQKKDIYGVYAEPVDPDELPDYHDVIKHPMDFATVRKKLAKGTYLTLEQFESDVLLICTNAMQYNAPDTIYYKQASSIQELAKRKFQRLRLNVDHSGIEMTSGQKTKPSLSPPKKLSKKLVRAVQEPVGSDLSGATPATTGEFQNGLSAQATSVRPRNFDALIAENYSLVDNKLDKGDDLIPGKGFAPRLGRKPPVHDENRRATFNISIQPVIDSESIFSPFEGESKQFIPVGLHADHSYARSLARFAATLGSVAWKIASQRIEQALPEGIKFGRGWVGEYEPLPTPVVLIGNCTLKESDFLTRYLSIADVRTDKKASRNTAPGDDKASKNHVPANEKASTNPVHHKEHDVTGFNLQKLPVLGNASGTSNRIPAKRESPRGASWEMGPPSASFQQAKPSEVASIKHLQQNSTSRNLMEPEKKDLPQAERTYPSPTHKTAAKVARRPISNASDFQSPRPAGVVSRNKDLWSLASFKHPNGNNDGFVSGGLRSRKPTLDGTDCNTFVTPSSNVGTKNKIFPQQQEQQGVSDPVQMMRKLAEKAQHQEVYSNGSPFGLKREGLNDVASTASEFALKVQHQQIPSNGSPVCPKRENSTNVASTAAHEWMSLGGVTRSQLAENRHSHRQQMPMDSYHHQPPVPLFCSEFPVPRTHFQPDKNGGHPQPIHAFVPQPVRGTNEAQLHNREEVFPQLVTADLSRFQVQSHWRGITPHITQQQQQPPRSKQQESRPPDLNIGYQSVQSPVRQSSGMLVDSQHPDLALQL